MKPLRIAQISDFHFTELTYNPFRLFSKRLLGLLNWIFFRKGLFSTKSVEAIPDLLKTLSVDQILLGGDFTSTALPTEFERATRFIKRLPAPWIAIPGNHDHYTYRAYHQKHYYKAIQNKQPLTGPFTLSDHGVEALRLNDHWWLISLDTARATNLYSSRGHFSKKQEGYLNELFSSIPADHSILLFNHYPFFQHSAHRRTLKRGEALEEILKRDRRIKAYLHGHTHQHILADLQPSGLPLVLDSGCSADEKYGSWNLLTLDDRGVQVDVYRWTHEWKIERTEQIQWTR